MKMSYTVNNLNEWLFQLFDLQYGLSREYTNFHLYVLVIDL